MSDRGTIKRLDLYKWTSVFMDRYSMWRCGVITQGMNDFFIGMKVADFRKQWADRVEDVNVLYDQLKKFGCSRKEDIEEAL